MDWWRLWASQLVFEMQPNMVSVKKFQTKIQRYSACSWHLFKRPSTFLWNGSKEDSSSKGQLRQTPCLVETLCRTSQRRSINLMRGCSSLSHCPGPRIRCNTWRLAQKLLCTIYCCCFAQIRNLPNSIILSRNCQHKNDFHDCTWNIFIVLCMPVTTWSTQRLGGLREWFVHLICHFVWTLYVCIYSIHYRS